MRNLNDKYFLLFLFFSFLLFILILSKNQKAIQQKEAFTQPQNFVMKKNENVYDDFYAKIYDNLFLPESKSRYVVEKAFLITQPDIQKSTLLDIGSGTGELLKCLKEKGFKHVYGLDKSTAMITNCLAKNPELQVLEGDAVDTPMLFERNKFTHIFCIEMTIYEIQNKVTFFRNVHYWLKNNGYLFLHLVDPTRFNTIVPAGEPAFIHSLTEGKTRSIQELVPERIVNTDINFKNFEYRSSYDFSHSPTVFSETFTDNKSFKIRKNTKEMYFESVNDILMHARYCGFLVVGQIDFRKCNGDKYQHIFILERIH
jgi:SAM-dependent methyltransferase